jgi:tetratricopeptide (TPR) repeat protein
MYNENRKVRFEASAVLFAVAGLLAAKPAAWDRAFALYESTQYRESLKLLEPVQSKDAETLELIGKNHFMLAEYKHATEDFDKALDLGGAKAELYLWSGRAWGRRAETSSPFTAAGYATHARKMFEKAVELDPANKEAVGDLFDYYIGAPAFLGGGIGNAQDLEQRVAKLDPAEGAYLQAQIDEKRNEYDKAEQHLRRARELAPKQVGRVMDLARFLAKRGRLKESEALFDQASSMAPQDPRVLFERAEVYVEGRRNLDDARRMLQTYLNASLTPDDPPRERARELLGKTRR